MNSLLLDNKLTDDRLTTEGEKDLPLATLSERLAGLPTHIPIVVARAGNLNIGLPLHQVERTIVSPQIYGLEKSHWIGSANIGDRQISVLDLHRAIFSNNDLPHTGSHLTIATHQNGSTYGILVDGIPSIVEIATANIRLLSAGFRQTNPLGIARYVATIDPIEEIIGTTIFILDF
jgi:chemotaxis signal transduction protein